MANKLAGNPIVLPIYTGANSSGRYRIYANGVLVYDGTAYSISGVAQVDISGLFESYITQAVAVHVEMVTVHADGIEYKPIAGEGNSPNYNVFTLYGGAIGDILVRKLANVNTDVFAWKLKNAGNNFLLTTRTNSRTICIPENEFGKIYYYGKGLKFKLYNSGTWLASFDHTGDAVEMVKMIDLAQLRRDIFNEKGKLISHFDFAVDVNTYSFTIVLTEANPTHYFLKFKNSWGVDELIGIEGEMTFEPELSENKTIQTYDSVVKRMVNSSQRKNYKSVYTANLGNRDVDGRLFVLDALMSDVVKLVVNEVEYECRISADRQTFDTTSAEPLPITIRIELKDITLAACNIRDNATIDGGTLEDEYQESNSSRGLFEYTFENLFK